MTYIILQPKQSDSPIETKEWKDLRPFVVTRNRDEYEKHYILFESKDMAKCKWHCAIAQLDPNYCLLLRAKWMSEQGSSNVSDVWDILSEAVQEWTY